MIVDIIGDVPDMLGFGENHMGFKRKELLFSHWTTQVPHVSPRVAYAPWSCCTVYFPQKGSHLQGSKYPLLYKESLMVVGVTISRIPGFDHGTHGIQIYSNDGKRDVLTIERVDLNLLTVDWIDKHVFQPLKQRTSSFKGNDLAIKKWELNHRTWIFKLQQTIRSGGHGKNRQNISGTWTFWHSIAIWKWGHKSNPKQTFGSIPMIFQNEWMDIQPSNSYFLVSKNHVLIAGCGANSARQAALLAEVPATVDCFGVNKGCASGLKALTLAAQAIAMGQASCGETQRWKLEPGFLGESWIHMVYIYIYKNIYSYTFTHIYRAICSISIYFDVYVSPVW